MEGYRTATQIDGGTLSIDAGTETDPSPTETLLASYAPVMLWRFVSVHSSVTPAA